MTISRKISEDVKYVFIQLTNPVSSDEDLSRREFILNVLLIGTIALSLFVTISRAVTLTWVRQRGLSSHGLPLSVLVEITIFFLILYGFSKLGKSRVIAYVFVIIYFLLALYTSYHWGVYAPQALLVAALVIVMSGVLIHARFAAFITFLTCTSIFFLFKMQQQKRIIVDSSWLEKPVHMGDIAVYIATLLIIFIVSWLSSREIEKSLIRARRSEVALKKEKDLLEVKVKERTEEIQKIQYEKMRQLYRFAEFGRISSGLFHDLNNYLSALSLNLEKVKEEKVEIIGAKSYLEQAITASHRMEDFIDAIQKQIKRQEVRKNFSLKEELDHVIKVLEYKARKENVTIICSCCESVIILGDPIKFNQVFTNIISNAIDAYEEDNENLPRHILIELKKEAKDVVITVQDWGVGIPKENLSRIFDIFFTTKDLHKGTGIGLSTSRDIVINDFSGDILVESAEGKGTRFVVSLPANE